MSSEHQHSHNHSHAHNHDAIGRMSWAFFINLGFAVIELIGGAMTNSLAITSDAIHDLGDAFAIGIAWILEHKSKRGHDKAFSYGYRRFSVMASLITGVILFAGSCFIMVRAIPRLFQPEQLEINGMIGFAVLGVCVNGFAAYRMSKGVSLSERMILLHLLEDVLGWVVILIGSIVMHFISLPILDPIMALAVAIWVLWNAFSNLKETMQVFLQATPSNIDMGQIEKTLKEFERVRDVHHTHLWSMDGVHHILTTHVIVSESSSILEIHQLKTQIKKRLSELYHVQEATIEIEWSGQECLDPQH